MGCLPLVTDIACPEHAPQRIPAMSVTRISILESSIERLEEGGIDDARRNVEWMLEKVLGLNRAGLYAHGDVSITAQERERIDDFVARRLNREPIQYILGHTEFFGLQVDVSPSVLIPRPETEEVVEEALRVIEAIDSPWVLDVGTGSGAIALAIKSKRPDAEVFACDLSEPALEVATDNAERLKLSITFIHADVLDPLFATDVSPAFDLVVSNPPYVPNNEHDSLQAEVRAHEPSMALFVPDCDPMCFYSALGSLSPSLLKAGGRLVAETHADYGHEVVTVFESAGLDDVVLRKDLSGRPRIVSGTNLSD